MITTSLLGCRATSVDVSKDNSYSGIIGNCYTTSQIYWLYGFDADGEVEQVDFYTFKETGGWRNRYTVESFEIESGTGFCVAKILSCSSCNEDKFFLEVNFIDNNEPILSYQAPIYIRRSDVGGKFYFKDEGEYKLLADYFKLKKVTHKVK
ncbi:hypothetical protein LP316_15790 [Thalassotalea sp. LPB0316]|uniref:hypothetical protein n=1 Tax=Thalassotalea sp. LPB0316 TaxID=2769490 RepID=UPI001868ECBC|nr:hypothetical protein [Thalassotalea sp. LPB0316]QOL25724.1 hypothetical protein LP316_15790 [Thalassotalea sp. LPB0316]